MTEWNTVDRIDNSLAPLSQIETLLYCLEGLVMDEKDMGKIQDMVMTIKTLFGMYKNNIDKCIEISYKQARR